MQIALTDQALLRRFELSEPRIPFAGLEQCLGQTTAQQPVLRQLGHGGPKRIAARGRHQRRLGRDGGNRQRRRDADRSPFLDGCLGRHRRSLCCHHVVVRRILQRLRFVHDDGSGRRWGNLRVPGQGLGFHRGRCRGHAERGDACLDELIIEHQWGQLTWQDEIVRIDSERRTQRGNRRFGDLLAGLRRFLVHHFERAVRLRLHFREGDRLGLGDELSASSDRGVELGHIGHGDLFHDVRIEDQIHHVLCLEPVEGGRPQWRIRVNRIRDTRIVGGVREILDDDIVEKLLRVGDRRLLSGGLEVTLFVHLGKSVRVSEPGDVARMDRRVNHRFSRVHLVDREPLKRGRAEIGEVAGRFEARETLDQWRLDRGDVDDRHHDRDRVERSRVERSRVERSRRVEEHKGVERRPDRRLRLRVAH